MSSPAPNSLKVQHISCRFGARVVVQNVSFEVHPGEIVGLLGPNGAGKTTSFNVVAGLTRASAGSVWLGEHNLSTMPLFARVRLGLGYLPQEPTVFRGLSARDNLRVVLERQGAGRAEGRVKADAALARSNLAHVADVLGQSLSGGERRRLEMARALLCDPCVLLLDEPFAGVDPIAVGALQSTLRQVAASGVGVLITDHNVAETLRLCHRAYLMYEGRLLAQGTPEQIVADQEARRVYLGEGFRL